MTLIVSEIPSSTWELKPCFSFHVDRSNQTVAEYLESRRIVWRFDGKAGDVFVYKGEAGPNTLKKSFRGLTKRYCSRQPTVTLLGEPRELSPAEYLFANPATTLAVAPGDKLKRLYFANTWADPQLDDWERRLDRICWIGRPTAERIEIARTLIERGVPLDIYSRTPWPLANWKGYSESEEITSRLYRYRIVCENSRKHGYHSEKLFNSIRCGCVTFYHGDVSVDLSHTQGAYLVLTMENILHRNEIASKVLSGIDRFMFSDAWEVYSFRSFYDRLIGLIQTTLG